MAGGDRQAELTCEAVAQRQPAPAKIGGEQNRAGRLVHAGRDDADRQGTHAALRRDGLQSHAQLGKPAISLLTRKAPDGGRLAMAQAPGGIDERALEGRAADVDGEHDGFIHDGHAARPTARITAAISAREVEVGRPGWSRMARR